MWKDGALWESPFAWWGGSWDLSAMPDALHRHVRLVSWLTMSCVRLKWCYWRVCRNRATMKSLPVWQRDVLCPSVRLSSVWVPLLEMTACWEWRADSNSRVFLKLRNILSLFRRVIWVTSWLYMSICHRNMLVSTVCWLVWEISIGSWVLDLSARLWNAGVWHVGDRMLVQVISQWHPCLRCVLLHSHHLLPQVSTTVAHCFAATIQVKSSTYCSLPVQSCEQSIWKWWMLLLQRQPCWPWGGSYLAVACQLWLCPITLRGSRSWQRNSWNSLVRRDRSGRSSLPGLHGGEAGGSVWLLQWKVLWKSPWAADRSPE